MKKLRQGLRLMAFGALLVGVGCGASGTEGFSSDDGGPANRSAGNDAGAAPSSTKTTPVGDAGSASGGAADAGSSSGFVATDAGFDAGPAPFCIHNPGGSCGGSTETVTFTGTATETAPLAGAPQLLTFTLTGVGVSDCWLLNEGHTPVQITTNLWGDLPTNPDDPSSFAFALGGATLSVNPPSGAPTCDSGGDNSFFVTAPEKNSHFSGNACIKGISYDLELDPPAGTRPCIALPNCALGNPGSGSLNCGGSIDGYPENIYQCASVSAPATLFETCASPTFCVQGSATASCDE